MKNIFLIIVSIFFAAFATGQEKEGQVVETHEFYLGAFPTIKAKIGKKEGVGLDATYFAVQDFTKSNGEKKTKRMGVVRATNKIGDNTSDGNALTTFYQVRGGKIDNQMYLVKKNEIGLGIYLSLSQPLRHSTDINFEDEYGNTHTINNQARDIFYAKFDYNISPLLYKISNKFFITDLRICFGISGVSFKKNKSGDVTWNTSTDTPVYSGGEDSYNEKPRIHAYTFFGISKDFHIRKRIAVAPFFQFWKGKENYTSYGFQVSLQLLKNLSYFAAFRWYSGWRPGETLNTADMDRIYFLNRYVDRIGIKLNF